MSLETGQIVGDYRVIGVLGAGGMGSVYKVQNLISDRMDAMKVLLPDLRSSPALAERFLNEIKVLASFSHPNIAALHTALRVNNQLLMIMELVDGTNLEDRLAHGPLPVGEVISYLSQALSALSYAHGRGVVHRDIKPANIAINSAGTVKLLDFGIARGEMNTHLTRTGMVLGSLFFMSPEQVSGRAADARSDLYSVGVTLYKAITGKRPVEGDSEYAVMRAQTEAIPIPPHELNPALPRALSDAIMRALAKSPDDRFQSADDFRRALQAFAGDTTQAMTGQTSGDSVTPVPSQAGFHSAALTALRMNLAQWLGPIAGAVVKQQAQIAADLPELCRLLASVITNQADRQAFLDACKRDLGAQASAQTSAHTATRVCPAPALDAALLERAKKHLAGFIGPLARIVVDRAAKKAASVEEFYALLGAEISSPKERERFFATR
jgi:hypothetical protein